MATVRIVFSREAGLGTTTAHADLGGQPLSLLKRTGPRRPRTWLTRALGQR
jgi:hypothetical protein